MRKLIRFNLFICLTIIMFSAFSQSAKIPHLQKKGTATQLIVDGKPFLMLGGELGNSTSSSIEYMAETWPVLETLNLNTVLAPVYWELVEREEGKFDFSLVEDLILNARRRNIHLVLLWFGSWKNSMSCYAPGWVKNDSERFPRARDKNDKPVEILSPFIKANQDADKKAFAELMKFIKNMDGENHTVIMVQVENEIGMLFSARDYHPEAVKAFNSPVPNELTGYLEKNRNQLMPEFRSVWENAGAKTGGTWKEIFGDAVAAEEIFMAWQFGKYVEDITAAGKAVYNLPMYVNAALNRPGWQPGQYPGAGPLPHLMDVWRAAAPSIDFLAPDIYFADFKKWCKLYDRGGNPLFLPEVRYESFSGAESYEPAPGPKAFYAFGNHDALGFSPFHIESTSSLVNESMTGSYEILKQLSPLILEHQGTGTMKGFLFDKKHQTDTIQLGGYRILAKHDYTLGWSPDAINEVWPITGALIICTGEGEYFVAGKGIILNFPAVDSRTMAGIETIDEGTFENGHWKPKRRLNGDQTHQGRHLRITNDGYGIQYLKLYKYE